MTTTHSSFHIHAYTHNVEERYILLSHTTHINRIQFTLAIDLGLRFYVFKYGTQITQEIV